VIRASVSGSRAPSITRGERSSAPQLLPSLKGASETFPFGPKVSVFKVSGTMFALSILAQVPLRISLKSEPELAEQLRATHAAVLPGYHRSDD
jgi:predicted DNA-binding protein (MmcQ/YjbR family)